MYHCILVALTLSLSLYIYICVCVCVCETLFLENNKNILLKRFTYIFLLTYILNTPKINDLYMTKKKINIKRKIKETTIN